ncbi:conserved hypothetical protein [Paraburkholderia tropica]|uniref:hypothetical protein n=1 Tax=Paraburkholderia tropica TaxID=92647 RepID=UPI001CB64919|nr:hypothetical protein [Paraburkholderia tropica]CAG9239645.1 conserved hypothetical protein [Paraburkholderia tropica]
MAEPVNQADNGLSSPERASRGAPSRRRSPAQSLESPDPQTPDARELSTLDLFGDSPDDGAADPTASAGAEAASPEAVSLRAPRLSPASASSSSSTPTPAARRPARPKAPMTPMPEGNGTAGAGAFGVDAPRVEPVFAAVLSPAPMPVSAAAEPAGETQTPPATPAVDARAEPFDFAPPVASAQTASPIDPAAPGWEPFVPFAPATGAAAAAASFDSAADFKPAASPEPALAAWRADTVAALAAQARRTKWMLIAAVTALGVTVVVAIAQTLMIATLSSDNLAQQQRIDVQMQKQQASLDAMSAQLAAAAAAPVAAVAPPAPAPVSKPAAPAEPRHVKRAAKPAERAAAHATSRTKAHAHSQQTAR